MRRRYREDIESTSMPREGYTTFDRTHGRASVHTTRMPYGPGAIFFRETPRSPPEEFTLPPYPVPPPYPGKCDDTGHHNMGTHATPSWGSAPSPDPPPAAHVHINSTPT